MRVKVCVVLVGISVLRLTQLGAQAPSNRWVDSVYSTMTLKEKIGQLFFLSVSGRATPDHIIDLQSQVKSVRPGGVLFTDGGPSGLVRINRILQNLSAVPMLTCIDVQKSLTGSVDSMVATPPPLLMSAVRHDSLNYEMAREAGRQFNEMGIDLAIGMSVRPQGPSLQYRELLSTFGYDEATSLNQADLVLSGLASRNVYTAILFPESLHPAFDSKPAPIDVAPLPSADSSLRHLQNIFQLQPPALYVPWSSSSKIQSKVFVSPFLRSRLGFDGLIIGDAGNFRASTGKLARGAAEDLAFYSGFDIILHPENLTSAVRLIQRRIRKEPKLQEQLDHAVRKILKIKHEAGLAVTKRLPPDHIIDRLNSPNARILRQRIYEGSVTLLSNSREALPVRTIDNMKLVSLSVGRVKENELNRVLRRHAPFELIEMQSLRDTSWIYQELDRPDLLVVSIFQQAPDSLGHFLRKLAMADRHRAVVVVNFGDPRALSSYPDLSTHLVGYTDDDETLAAVGQAILGAIPVDGLLPLPIEKTFGQGYGLTTPRLDRLAYATPEAAQMDASVLEGINRVAWEAIDNGATPGCHVLVARKGKVVFERSYGWQTYNKRILVNDETIYDLASVTKISATLQTIMFLHERGMVDLHKKASVYLPELKESNKKDFTLKDILTHQAGLWPFLPFWQQTIQDSLRLPLFYNQEGSDDYTLPVSQGLYATKAMKDSLWRWIVTARIRDKPLRTPHDYRYSDMGFYILQHLAEALLNQPIEDFLSKILYEPLGASTTGYLPLGRFPENRIAPTEDDRIFRKSLLTGYVHDQGAAMHGGIAGHAGLFSSAIDLAKLGQMWLQKGTYGGLRYFKPETIELFSSKQFYDSRRGLGWDKPPLSDWTGPTSLFSSPEAFGHTGFTGTCIWVDPQFELVYVFLSNRVHPDMNNNKLLAANIRSRIQDVIYESIFSFCQYAPTR